MGRHMGHNKFRNMLFALLLLRRAHGTPKNTTDSDLPLSGSYEGFWTSVQNRYNI